MIIQGILNFFKNLKYFFTPLGAIALGFIFGLSILIPGVMNAVDSFSGEIQDILAHTTIDFEALRKSLTDAINTLDWSQPLTAITTMFTSDWLITNLSESINALIGGAEGYTTQLVVAVDNFLGQVALHVVALILLTFLGVLAGFFITKFLIRQDIARRAFWKYFFISFIDALITTALVAVCLYLMSLWRMSIFISSFVALLLMSAMALFEAYIVHGHKKMHLLSVVNSKNTILLFITNLLIFLMAAGIIWAMAAITNQLVGVFVGIAVAEIAFIVISLNAEAYVKKTTEKVALENEKALDKEKAATN